MRTKRGRRTKLTPEIQEQVVSHILAGYTLTAAAYHVGIARSSLFYWLRRGQMKRRNEFSEFSDLVCAALEDRRETRIKGNPRALARAMYEYKKPPRQIAIEYAEEIQRVATEGRVPLEVAIVGLGLALDEMETRRAEGSLAHCEKQTRIFGIGPDEMEELTDGNED